MEGDVLLLDPKTKFLSLGPENQIPMPNRLGRIPTWQKAWKEFIDADGTVSWEALSSQAFARVVLDPMLLGSVSPATSNLRQSTEDERLSRLTHFSCAALLPVQGLRSCKKPDHEQEPSVFSDASIWR
jgi:hypothetical protein